ncbi:hypothetical protein DL767_010989 [Monosporascus sp. MG133]|nr:hypothetical protein DL767_010989 [Monosporascus sp. MG133]
MYLSSLVGEVADSLEDRFVLAALSSPAITHSKRQPHTPSPGPTGRPHILHGPIAGHSDDTSIYPPSTASLTFRDEREDSHQEQDVMVDLYDLELYQLDPFTDTDSLYSPERISDMCFLGLNFIYDILLADA